jgi:hypothetical protein
LAADLVSVVLVLGRQLAVQVVRAIGQAVGRAVVPQRLSVVVVVWALVHAVEGEQLEAWADLLSVAHADDHGTLLAEVLRNVLV